MCLLIAKPAGTDLPENFEEICKDATAANSDGSGFGIPSGVFRRYGIKYDDFAKIARENISREDPAIIHFRWSTSGKLNDKNCHPFQMPDGGMFAHNGVIASKFTPRDGLSDTAVLAKEYNNTQALYLKCQELSSSANKFAIITPKEHQLLIVGESHGKWEDGLWFSNMTWKGRSSTFYDYGYDDDCYDYQNNWYNKFNKNKCVEGVRELVSKFGLSKVLESLEEFCEEWKVL